MSRLQYVINFAPIRDEDITHMYTIYICVPGDGNV